MDTLEFIFSQLADFINAGYMLAFIFLSYIMLRQVKVKDLIEKRWPIRIAKVFYVLIFSTILGIIWAVFFVEGKQEYLKLIISYLAGTSLYELLLKYLEKKIHKE
jgi:amino acid transporter